MQWQIQKKAEDITVGTNRLHPVLETLLEMRGLTEEAKQDEFLSPEYQRDIHSPFLFVSMEKVVARVEQAQEKKETVGIFGDFDADGVTASVILREGLTMIGIEPLVYLPDKLSEGHGLSRQAVEYFADKGATLIFTLDCGMMNHEEILLAKEKGIETIVVDHHHVPEVLPESLAIVNPKLPKEQYPFRDLCGAGTTFKVVQAIIEKLLPEKQESLKWLLDVVAIGTVADVMPLTGENRALVKYGLLVLSKTRRKGLAALLETVNNFSLGGVAGYTAEFIAFQIAPRINAASRMKHALVAHNLLMSSDETEARILAAELQALNTARQKQSQKITEEIQEKVQRDGGEKYFILAAEEHYPYGIVGLIAGRIASMHQRPVCILTREGEYARGSFRSIPGFSVIEALTKCEALLEKYGGHEQAAGMQIKSENIKAFEEQFEGLVKVWFEKENKKASDDTILSIDMELSPIHLTPELLKGLEKMEPFGEGNAKPVFLLAKQQVETVRALGSRGDHLKLTLLLENQKKLDVIGFGFGKMMEELQPGMYVDVVGTLGENIWQGRRSMQLQLLDLRMW